jgi:hypothetical protein
MDEILEGLNVFRALEAWGAELYAAWATSEPDPVLRTGHLIIAEREANHARLLAERIRALGGVPGPACVDDVLAAQLSELRGLGGLVAQIDGLRACNARDEARMAPCRQALERGFEAARRRDPDTHRWWAALYSEEKVSGQWYRDAYRAVADGTPLPAPPVLAPGQVERRARAAAVTAGDAACAVAD